MRKQYRAVILLCLAIVVSVSLMAALRPEGKKYLPPVVIRIDDIQDFAFRQAQFYLLNESMINRVPISLSVIPGRFGEDREIVQLVRLSVSLGSEVAAHGWLHEDFGVLSYQDQVVLLGQAKARLQETLGYEAGVFVAPMFQFNAETPGALKEAGYHILSSFINLTQPDFMSPVSCLPGTMNLSDYSSANETWTMKPFSSIQAELAESVNKYGFAVIVTHPQEFLKNSQLDDAKTDLYSTLLGFLKEDYNITTFEQLGASYKKNDAFLNDLR